MKPKIIQLIQQPGMNVLLGLDSDGRVWRMGETRGPTGRDSLQPTWYLHIPADKREI